MIFPQPHWMPWWLIWRTILKIYRCQRLLYTILWPRTVVSLSKKPICIRKKETNLKRSKQGTSGQSVGTQQKWTSSTTVFSLMNQPFILTSNELTCGPKKALEQRWWCLKQEQKRLQFWVQSLLLVPSILKYVDHRFLQKTKSYRVNEDVTWNCHNALLQFYKQHNGYFG